MFDSSGPAVFARAMIHTYETHEEDPIRKCFFSVTRDEVNHEEVCGRAIQLFTPGGPLGYEPQTPLGKLARNNVEWLYHNGARYWDGFKKGVHKYPLPILFTSFLFGEIASATLFHGMHQRTTIPVLKEAFRCVGKDEARHLGICLADAAEGAAGAHRRGQAARSPGSCAPASCSSRACCTSRPRISGSCRRPSRRRTAARGRGARAPASAC